MTMDFNLLKCTKGGDEALKNGKLRRGFAALYFPKDCSHKYAKGESEYFDLRGFVRATVKFTNWAKRHYDDFDVEFG